MLNRELTRLKIYKPIPNPDVKYYEPKSDLVIKHSGGRYSFSWWQKDLINIMVGMNLPISEIAEGSGVSPATISRYLADNNLYRDEIKIAKVSAELSKNKVVDYLLHVTYNDYGSYCHYARRLTKAVIKRWVDFIDPTELLGNYVESHREGTAYNVDHKLSVYDGFNKFKKPLPLAILCHPVNLQVITRKENTDKGKQSSIGIVTLKRDIEKFNKHCNPYVDFPLPAPHYVDKYVRKGYHQ